MDDAAGIGRGHVLWAADPFKRAADTERPFVVLNDDTHPFADEQWIAAAVSTTPRPHALEITEENWTHGTLPQQSHAYPWAIVSPRIETIDYVVGSVTNGFVNELVAEVGSYIGLDE
ncbi:hypothetical protein [Halococcus thailandensis]|uniref:PemK family protein n=1 Tax=Halococcus thailandensis JCM 13552 TaxID=1227457 RepID=M0N4H6_9EURY|nr:hypothetical protein [Halococcus thailandensis]EMA52847.1 hypothetical protein C451_10510 [Halococcus thailandensis JCM 13552]